MTCWFTHSILLFATHGRDVHDQCCQDLSHGSTRFSNTNRQPNFLFAFPRRSRIDLDCLVECNFLTQNLTAVAMKPDTTLYALSVRSTSVGLPLAERGSA